MESYFRVSADAADTDKRLRREYMRFVWRKRRAYLPGFVFSLVILFVIAPVSAFLAAGRGGYELLFVGIACLLYMLLLPNIASSMLGRGRRAAWAQSTISRRFRRPARRRRRRRSDVVFRITEIVELPACLFFLRAEKGGDRFKGSFYFGRSRSLRRVHLGALRQRDHRVFRQTRAARRSRSRRDPSCRGDHGMRGRARHQIRGARLRKFRRERSGARIGGRKESHLMNILMVTMSLGIGGVETHITELTKELIRRGHRVTVASAGGVYVPEITASGRIARHPSACRSIADRTCAGVLRASPPHKKRRI